MVGSLRTTYTLYIHITICNVKVYSAFQMWDFMARRHYIKVGLIVNNKVDMNQQCEKVDGRAKISEHEVLISLYSILEYCVQFKTA